MRTYPRVPITVGALHDLLVLGDQDLLKWIMGERPEIGAAITNGVLWRVINRATHDASEVISAEMLIWSLKNTGDHKAKEHRTDALRYSCAKMDLPSAQAVWSHLREHITRNCQVIAAEFIKACSRWWITTTSITRSLV